MNRKKLLKILNSAGCVLIRNGEKHDWYQNPATKICQPIPGHTDISLFFVLVIQIEITSKILYRQEKTKCWLKNNERTDKRPPIKNDHEADEFFHHKFIMSQVSNYQRDLKVLRDAIFCFDCKNRILDRKFH